VAVARPTRARATVAALALAVPLGFAGVSLSRQVLGEHYRDQASAELAQHPRAALADAGKALRLAPEDVQASYTKAAALARFDDAAGARAVLEQALKRDPTNYVTLALLGDLAIRTGDRATARARYREALRRNPRDAELRRLVRDPGRALAPRG
jgi:cytochrome c-type biogenesis protein CcmH/NrfG